MQTLTRRQALLILAGATAGLLMAHAAQTRRNRLGIVIYALGIHEKNNWAGRHPGLAPALAFLEECRRLGAGGIQCQLRPSDTPYLLELRRRAEHYEMQFDASLDPPRDEADVPRFETDLRRAKEAGASLARTVIMPGRRYEEFKTLGEFHQFEARGLKSLQLAEPILSRHRFPLAVENHKDQLVEEKLALLKRLSSEWIGLCVDVGNNLALMEDPLETVRAFAPFALTIHFKDMALKEYADGWLLADVALGDGLFDLKQMVEILRAARPDVKFFLESITRDPLKLPVRTDAFWATFPGPRTAALERVSALLKSRRNVKFPGNISDLPIERQLEEETRVVERSLAYANRELNL